MFRYTKILFSAWVAIAGYAIKSRFPGGELKMDSLIQAIVPTATDGWLMLVYGIGIGLFFIPCFIQWLEQGNEFERFFIELGAEKMGRARTRFFKNFSRGYEKWKSINNCPHDNIDKLIRTSDFPSWIPVTEGELRHVAEEKYTEEPTYLWQFIRDLNNEIENYIRAGEMPDSPLLTKEEIEEFHEARQTLSYFWNNVGIRLVRWRKLRYRNIKPYAESEKDLIKCLSYQSIESQIRLIREGRGQEITYLGAIVFKKTRWGLKQWAWNPILSRSENFRT